MLNCFFYFLPLYDQPKCNTARNFGGHLLIFVHSTGLIDPIRLEYVTKCRWEMVCLPGRVGPDIHYADPIRPDQWISGLFLFAPSGSFVVLSGFQRSLITQPFFCGSVCVYCENPSLVLSFSRRDGVSSYYSRTFFNFGYPRFMSISGIS